MSKISLYEESNDRRNHVDPISEIFGRIREDIMRTKRQMYSWETVLGLCRGFTVRLWLNDLVAIEPIALIMLNCLKACHSAPVQAALFVCNTSHTCLDCK